MDSSACWVDDDDDDNDTTDSSRFHLLCSGCSGGGGYCYRYVLLEASGYLVCNSCFRVIVVTFLSVSGWVMGDGWMVGWLGWWMGLMGLIG